MKKRILTTYSKHGFQCEQNPCYIGDIYKISPRFHIVIDPNGTSYRVKTESAYILLMDFSLETSLELVEAIENRTLISEEANPEYVVEIKNRTLKVCYPNGVPFAIVRLRNPDKAYLENISKYLIFVMEETIKNRMEII